MCVRVCAKLKKQILAEIQSLVFYNFIKYLARPVHNNCTILSNSIYPVYKFLCDFIQWKPISEHPKKSGKRLTSAPSSERFPPKADRH